MTTIKPYRDMIIMKPIVDKEKKVGGVIIPGLKDDNYTRGLVLACGPGIHTDKGKFIPMPVRPGDKVLYQKYSYSELQIGNDKYQLVRAEHIVKALIEDENEQ